ncbi:MAG TPA: alkaline phytoceramidase [Thiobacillus sp.]|nr:alkaline phytoceramidase [Thiobacillus sp.]
MSAWRPPRARALGLWLLAGALAGLAWMLPPIPQPLGYHAFADQRACWGLPHCLDTASNALIVLAGAMGLRFLLRGQGVWRDRREAWPYQLFFFATILAGFGSGYYHLAPGNGRLLGDRLAMMLAFMAWFAAIVSERVSPRAGLRLLPLLAAAGLGSAAWWGWSEARGIGDLRPYLLMQLYPMLLIPLLLRFYPPRYSGDRTILAVIGLYLLALLCDLGDRPIFALTGGRVSGHTIKHLIAALAVVGVVLHLRRRTIKQA